LQGDNSYCRHGVFDLDEVILYPALVEKREGLATKLTRHLEIKIWFVSLGQSVCRIRLIDELTAAFVPAGVSLDEKTDICVHFMAISCVENCLGRGDISEQRGDARLAFLLQHFASLA